MSIIRRIYKQGNSQVISIPAHMWHMIEAELGDKVEIEGIQGRRLEITLKSKGVMPGQRVEGDQVSGM